MFIYTTTPGEWKEIQTRKAFHDARFPMEGFIHCSYPDQTLWVLNKHYQKEKTVILLVIDPGKLASPWTSEDLKNRGEEFPHVYGPINLSAVVASHDISREDDGVFHENHILTRMINA
ncbi:MAG: DUF952 domain-containing protein [Desulfobacterium sp.]|nr:DUF952 domain-containing protein [Desulfobacterium sp.]